MESNSSNDFGDDSDMGDFDPDFVGENPSQFVIGDSQNQFFSLLWQMRGEEQFEIVGEDPFGNGVHVVKGVRRRLEGQKSHQGNDLIEAGNVR